MHCWARYIFVLVVIALGTLSMLGACGQKGPLVLPDKAQEKAPGQARAKPADVPKTPDQTLPQPSNQNADLLAWPMGND